METIFENQGGHTLELILIILAVIAIAILLFYLVQTMISAQKTLRRLDIVLGELDGKINKLSPFFNTLENVGEVAEKESFRLKTLYATRPVPVHEKNDAGELASLLISGLSLGIKYFKRR